MSVSSIKCRPWIFSGKSLCLAIVTIYLAVIAGGIYQKTKTVVAPPIYDPISYYSKSRIVWDAISHHEWKRILNEFPGRPPGTAFVLYPFGFETSIKSFLFRSTFAPVVLWGIALMILLIPEIRKRSEGVIGSALIMGLMSMPVFYHFELCDQENACGISTQWGMVDGLEGSVGALALALALAGIKRSSKFFCLLSWLCAALSFFIKPSGILIIGCLFAIVLVEHFLLWKSHIPERRDIFRYGVFSMLTGGIITGLSLLLALNTDYLGAEVIHLAVNAAQVLISMPNKPLPGELKLLIVPVIGIWWFIPISLMTLYLGGATISSLLRLGCSGMAIRLLTAAALLCGALYWWVHMAGEEHRYLFPFILLSIAWFVPILFIRIISLGKSTRIFIVCYCLIPAMILGALLYAPENKANKVIENFLGYNLTTGLYGKEVEMGKFLIQESKKEKRPLQIYSLGGYGAGVIEMTDWVNSVENHEDPHFSIKHVNDWIRPGIKMKDLLSSDYFLLEHARLTVASSTKRREINWSRELVALTKFIFSIENNETKGLLLVSAGDVNLCKVVDKNKFAAACNEWVKSIDWEDDFFEQNSYEKGDFDPPGLKVIQLSKVQKIIKEKGSMISPIDFGGTLKLLGMTPLDPGKGPKEDAKETSQNSSVVTIFYWMATRKIEANYFIFIHLLDENKKMISQYDFEIDPFGNPIAGGTVWKNIVEIPKDEMARSAYLAFGAYIPNNPASFLKSDAKECDWNGNRVLLRLDH
jgi:hypothetical protein